jgi:hypothetical protein
MKRTLFFFLAVGSLSCASMVTIRGSSNDYLKQKGTMVPLTVSSAQVHPVLDQLFFERGFAPAGSQVGDNSSEIVFYKGARSVPPEAAQYGIQLGSWFAARLQPQGTGTLVTLLGKPMVGTIEICSDADDSLKDIKYACTDTRVPSSWAGQNYVTGRDEEEIVSWILNGLYERLKN